jgi:hypothetical protein
MKLVLCMRVCFVLFNFRVNNVNIGVCKMLMKNFTFIVRRIKCKVMSTLILYSM